MRDENASILLKASICLFYHLDCVSGTAEIETELKSSGLKRMKAFPLEWIVALFPSIRFESDMKSGESSSPLIFHFKPVVKTDEDERGNIDKGIPPGASIITSPENDTTVSERIYHIDGGV